MQITINEDATFLISDELGNVPAGAEQGLYHQDTRFLSQYELRLDGLQPLLLAAHATDYCSAIHFLTNPVLPNVPRGQLSVTRHRQIEQGLREEIEVANHADESAACTLTIHLDADFSHVFEVKSSIESHQGPLRRHGVFSREVGEDGRIIHVRNERGMLRSQLAIHLSVTPDSISENGDTMQFALHLGPRQRWHLNLWFAVQSVQEKPQTDEGSVDADGEADAGELVADAAVLRPVLPRVELDAPPLITDDEPLRQAYDQSVRDYLALRLSTEDGDAGEFVIGAGIPWFMTLFGRDSLIAAYQALPIFPEAAKGVLRALARLQGTVVDTLRAEEPGKIVHEARYGAGSGALRVLSMFPYYGTVDATPLFLILLAAVYRLTGDIAFVRTLRGPAERALAWMERYGDRDGDGYIEYLREAESGLANQGWKDSGDSVRFSDGRLAQGPIALCEVQGYAYAAYVGMAELYDALGEHRLADRQRQRAATLKQQFNREFWLPDRQFYALALDGDKRAVNSITSNPGHLLWTGIADDDKASLVARRMMSPEMFSGWGIRTMATSEGGYNPISYHCGSVWPHDCSLAVAGLARYGYTREAAEVTHGLLAALEHYADHRLPELFAGYSTAEAPFPVEYPTANRPQAWASGSVFLLVTAMAGIDLMTPGLRGHPFLPGQVDQLRLDGVWTGRYLADVQVRRASNGAVASSQRRVPIRGRYRAWLARLAPVGIFFT